MKKTYIVSCYFKHNYGSILQAYATQRFLDKYGVVNETISVETLSDFKKGKRRFYLSQIFHFGFFQAKFGMIRLLIKKKTSPRLRKYLSLRDEQFESFIKTHFRLTPHFNTYQELHTFCKLNAENVIVGSDQLWLPVNVVADYYTLNFVPSEINKVSFATSFGVASIPNSLESRYRQFLNRIDHLSVREDTGKRIVTALTDKQCTVVCDPTILLSKKEWQTVVAPKRVCDGKYIFCYFLGKSKKHRRFAEKLKHITGCRIVSVNHCDEYVRYSDKYADEIPCSVGPAEWLSLIANAEYVCTDSFHGTVFSLIFNKCFFSFKRYTKKSVFSTNSRLDTILTVVGQNERLYCGDETEEIIRDSLRNPIDYDSVNAKLLEYGEVSKTFILKSLKKNEDGDTVQKNNGSGFVEDTV